MSRHDNAWFDAQYDNRARVAGSAQCLARWAEASALARQQLPARLDLAYGEGPDEKLDVFPSAASGAPVLVFLHGGYWRALDKSDHSFLAPVFVDEGAVVVVPNYSLCPAASIDRIALQVVKALAWVWRHAEQFGGDPARIVVAGHSAGGHLAAMAACCDWKRLGSDLPRRLLAGTMSISGLHDLAALRRVAWLQADLGLDTAAVIRLSPARFPAPEGPVHALCGAAESEEFRRQNRLLRSAWGARAVPVCEELPGCDHFSVMHDLADPQGRSHQRARQLLGLRWYSGLL